MANTPSGSVTTTAKLLFSFGEETYFVLHAVAANGAIINYSMTDPTAITDFDELQAGQSVEFYVEPGDQLFIVAASGTQNYTIPVFKRIGTAAVRGT